MEYNFNWEEITEEELQKRIDKYYTEMGNLYDIMPTLTHEEYRKQFKEVFKTMHNLGQHIVLPNTTRIEQREFEVFGVHWHDVLNKESSQLPIKPLSRIIREGTDGTCPICKSTEIKRYRFFA